MKSVPFKLAMVSTLVILAGCATTNSNDTERLQAELNQAKAEAAEQSAEADRLRQQLAHQGQSPNSSPGPMSTGGDLLPPSAKPGECYARVLLPAEYETGQETVMVSAASDRIEIIPAEYGMVDETVMVREEATKLEVIPATYRTVTEQIMVEPEKTVIKEVPAEYEMVTEQLLVKPAYTTWKKGRGPIEKVDQATGEIMCLVEVPAEYKTVSKRVVKNPARTVEDVIPAQYKTITRTVVDTPATTREVVIPAEYNTVQVRKMTRPPETRRIEIPAEYETVSTRKLVKDSNMEWRPILCETNTTPGVVSRLQMALNDNGYDAGSPDGVLGSQTMSAVESYQKDNGLPSGQLTITVLEQLGVEL